MMENFRNVKPVVVIDGDFCVGKSMFFDSLLNGHYIFSGPWKCGMAAGGIVASAEDVPNGETRNGLSEWTEIKYKTQTEIALGFSTIFRRPLMDSEVFRKLNSELTDEEFARAIATDDGFTRLVDLDNEECRSILKSAADELWNKWRDNRASLSNNELEELRIATLQLRFYGSAEYRDMILRTVFSIDKFRKLVAVPWNWVIRWENGPDSQFMLDEVAFIFVKSVLVRVHSKILRRLGCRIETRPHSGLFNDAYSTAVAHRMIINADAVWLLINGGSMIGQRELAIIRVIVHMGKMKKTKVICNIWDSHEQTITEVIPATKAVLAHAGHAVEVFPYNARLAFLAMQGELLLSHAGKLSEVDKTFMLAEARTSDVNSLTSIWVRMVRHVGVMAELDNVENISELNAESVAMVRRESLLDNLISSLGQELAG